MSDHSSAEIYGNVFRLLAADTAIKHTKLAERIWKTSLSYDFHPCQMDCDEALLKLELAVEVPDPDYPEEKMIAYKGDPGFTPVGDSK